MMDTLTALLSAPVGGRELIASSKRQRWLKIAFILLLGGMTALHYLTSAHFLPYHTIYRSLYFLPIAIAVAVWGLRGLSAATRAFIITLREEGRGFVQETDTFWFYCIRWRLSYIGKRLYVLYYLYLCGEKGSINEDVSTRRYTR